MGKIVIFICYQQVSKSPVVIPAENDQIESAAAVFTPPVAEQTDTETTQQQQPVEGLDLEDLLNKNSLVSVRGMDYHTDFKHITGVVNI